MAEMDKALQYNPHLKEYLDERRKTKGTMPVFHEQLSKSMAGNEELDLIYPVGDPIFIHISGKIPAAQYTVIAPTVEDKHVYQLALDQIFEKIDTTENIESKEGMEQLIEEVVSEGLTEPGKGRSRGKKVSLTERQMKDLQFYIKRDIIGSGPLEPLARDPYLEDLHCVGLSNLYCIHKIFGMVRTSIQFDDMDHLEGYLKRVADLTNKRISKAEPIIDTAMPDDSRLNAIYASDVSKQGPSFTIRKFSATPMSIVQLVNFNTLSALEAAYLWLALENNMSIFVCGETASGKTTTLNGFIPFINLDSKIYSVEDTAEVIAPHNVWQEMITRGSTRGGTSVDTEMLLKSALRSRPNYIIVGEIRGQEGAIAFQAMQAGSSVLATFHADSVGKMVQRFTGDPINVPIRFMDNLNIMLIQQAIYMRGKALRRVLGIHEIVGYFKETNNVITKEVFRWDPTTDRHLFRGRYNSYILETLIAKRKLNYSDPRKIYDLLDRRGKIVEYMQRENLVPYPAFCEFLKKFQIIGDRALPPGF